MSHGGAVVRERGPMPFIVGMKMIWRYERELGIRSLQVRVEIPMVILAPQLEECATLGRVFLQMNEALFESTTIRGEEQDFNRERLQTRDGIILHHQPIFDSVEIDAGSR